MNSAILPDQTAIDLTDDNGNTIEQLQLDDPDPIFATCFRDLILEAFSEGKHFFIARIQSRQDQSNEADIQMMQTHSHFFSAYGIIKLLFQKKGSGEFVGRYHDRHPISAKNPITNAVSFPCKIITLPVGRKSLMRSSFT